MEVCVMGICGPGESGRVGCIRSRVWGVSVGAGGEEVGVIGGWTDVDVLGGGWTRESGVGGFEGVGLMS